MTRIFDFSFRRLWGIVVKEVIQLRRDRMTFAMILGIPLFQLFLFGYVINSDPRHLPSALLVMDSGPQERRLLESLRKSSYFDFGIICHSEAEVRELLARGKVTFVVNIPAGFSRDLVRGDRPRILLEADATDPVATAGALSNLKEVISAGISEEFKGPLSGLAPGELPVDLRIHALYNPDAIQQYNIVPGLIGIILTLTMVMITALAMTREHERGTMENLLSMPTRPGEVLIGKITPYIFIGYIQVGIILLASRYLFSVPILGSLFLLLLSSLLFIAGNLSLGIMFSTIARNQLQALQMTIFVFLPSILLSGFLFPFYGMPAWARYIGEVLPITHFLRIARGIMLKGNGWTEIGSEIWPIGVFTIIVMAVAIGKYRQTLD